MYNVGAFIELSSDSIIFDWEFVVFDGCLEVGWSQNSEFGPQQTEIGCSLFNSDTTSEYVPQVGKT